MFLLRKHVHLTLGLALLCDERLLFSVLMLNNPTTPNCMIDIHCITRGHQWLQIHARHWQKWNSTLIKKPTFGNATTGFPPNNIWETSTEISYWWRVTIQIWVVLLIGRPRGKFDSTNQKHYPGLGSDASSVWNFCARLSDVIWWGSQW